MRRSISWFLLLASFGTATAIAQPVSDEQLAAVARRVLGAAGPEIDPDVLFRLQLAAGRFEEARGTLAELRRIRTQAPRTISPLALMQYEVYTAAKVREARDGVPFEEAFATAFRELVSALDDRAAAKELQWVFGTRVGVARRAGTAPARNPLGQSRGQVPLRAAEQFGDTSAAILGSPCIFRRRRGRKHRVTSGLEARV